MSPHTSKGADAIAGALALAGASDLALVFEEQAVVADTKSRANRLANADHANLVRTSRARARADQRCPHLAACRTAGAAARAAPGDCGAPRPAPVALAARARARVRERRRARQQSTAAYGNWWISRIPEEISGFPARESSYLPLRRVRAPPAADTDPVRRHGPERGKSGGGVDLGATPPTRLPRSSGRRASGRADACRRASRGTRLSAAVLEYCPLRPRTASGPRSREATLRGACA